MADRRKAKTLLRRLTPKKNLYAEYLDDSKQFIEFFKACRIPKSLSQIYSVGLIRSECFKKKYLVAFVKPGWLKSFAPTCDAVASIDFSVLNRRSPPLIIIPGKSIPKKSGFSSIVEHEIVHINQALIKDLPRLDSCEIKDIFLELIRHAVTEYEAHVIQLSYDQTLVPPPEFGLSFEDWCHLRGFTSGLEIVVHRMIRGEISPSHIARLIKRIAKQLPSAFEEEGLSPKSGQDFASDIERMFVIAVSNVERHASP